MYNISDSKFYNDPNISDKSKKKMKWLADRKCKGFYWFDEKSQKPVGYIVVSDDRVITPIFIYIKYRGYGLSKQMINYAIDKLNADSLWVDKDNEVAMKVYKSMGFHITYQSKARYFMEIKK